MTVYVIVRCPMLLHVGWSPEKLSAGPGIWKVLDASAQTTATAGSAVLCNLPNEKMWEECPVSDERCTPLKRSLEGAETHWPVLVL